MEPTRFEVYTWLDKAERDIRFEEFRNSTEPNVRQVVKFSGAQQVDGKWVSDWSVAYPFEVTDEGLAKKIAPRHGSKRNPRQFPGRKEAV